MGFTIADYSLSGLQPQSFYVSIQGNFMINKITTFYSVSFTVYYSASKSQAILTQKQMLFNIQELPEPADIYNVIYNHIKKTINPDNILSILDD